MNYISVITFIFFLFSGCSSKPSNIEAKRAIKKSIYDYYTCNSFQVEDIKIDKVSLTQEADSKEWWPVRAVIAGKCPYIKADIFDPLGLFCNSTLDTPKDSSFIIEYQLNKNMFDEWEATTLK